MWLDKHWTGNPESVQRLSKLCQRSVQSQKKYGVCPIRYKVCPKSVELLSKSGYPGQRLDTEIQHLSTHCPTKNYQEAKSDLWQSLDKHWIRTKSGQKLDLISCGQWPNARKLPIWQTLDKHWTWTNSGQTLDIDKLWTKFGYLTFRPITDTWP